MTDDRIERALGDLQGTVRSLSEQWRRQDEAAASGRQVLYERFEMLAGQLLKMSHALESVTVDVAELRNDLKTEVMPTIDLYRMETARRLGVLSAGRVMWTFLVGVAGAVGFTVHEMLQFLTKKP